MKDSKELAYLYDLYIAPQWRETFDKLVDEEVKLPGEGKFLDAGCGTGAYAIDLAVRGGAKVEVVGVDESRERLLLARGKADVQHVKRVTFQEGSMTALGLNNHDFDLVIGDASLLPASQIEPALEELIRVAKKGATVVLKLTTRGSFDDIFSIYWEALFELELTNYTPRLEELILERLTVGDVEQLAEEAGLKQVRSVAKKEEFDYADAKTLFEAPLIETVFLDDWLAALPDDQTRRKVQERMARIIDRERHEMDFDVSIKATVVIGQK